jgi:glycosyltransferase involved in cell wall biosynthesis
VAICHLSWDWVWQRPQQFLSRLAGTHPVLFVETHCAEIPHGRVAVRTWDQNPALKILRMELPASRWHDGTAIDLERRRLLQEFLQTSNGRIFRNAILWINDPMAVTAYAGHLGESMVVYDCMDELSQFAGAPPGLLERERQLTLAADVIFCGGQKMRRKRLPLNGNTHFYGTGVDCDHFGLAMSSSLEVHPDMARLNGPVLGYFGVIDERIDYELLAALAEADPNWSIAMVGPFAKVDPGSLPRHANLHWLGPKSYQELPALTRGMDVCLMPFALNAATEYINPTKALEYMAAGKPVVSTALDEVRFNFSVAARIATSHDEFIALCSAEARSPSQSRIRKGLELAQDNTWETIVGKMNRHMADVLASRGWMDACAAAPTRYSTLTNSPSAYV